MAALTYAYGGHPFVVKLYCTFQDRERLYFAITYAKHGELLDWLQRLGSFDEAVSLFYAAEILSALEFLHVKCKVIHRDLKPENILVGADWHIMLSDFGTSKVLCGADGQEVEEEEPELSTQEESIASATKPVKSTSRSSFVGTAQYISPEVLKSESVGPECDYWALGAIIFQMISGQPPFRAVNEYQILKKILGLDFQFPDGFPETARDLVTKLLVYKPAERLGSRQTGGIVALKRHNYFKHIDWDNLASRTPPELKPFLPASSGEPAFYSDYRFPENLEPGLNEAALTRLMGLNFGEFEFAKQGDSPTLESSSSEVNNIPEDQQQQSLINQQRRAEKLDLQRRTHKFHRFVDDQLILKAGLIDKKKGLFARRRMFLMTEEPKMLYVDPVNMELRGEVPFSSDMRTEAKNFRTFFVHTPNRTYYLFDPERHAKDWCDAIDFVRDNYYKSTHNSINPEVSGSKVTSTKIESFFQAQHPGPYPNCKPTFEEITQLGKFPDPQYLSVRPEFVQKVKSCSYRCLGLQLHEHDNCLLPSNKEGFGVHIVVLDSVSRSHFFRALPKTTYVLREESEAISFKYLNKVGDNSQPNGWAFLLGKQIADILPSPFNDHVIPADTNQDEICNNYIDNQTSFVAHHFKKAGYTTMHSEDWQLGFFEWTQCKGFKKQPFDHYMRPFQMRMEQTFVPPRDPSKIYMNYHKNRCREPHIHLMEYFRQFVEQYEDVKAKYSLTWAINLVHHDTNLLYHADAHFFEYFQKLRHKLDNSFVFVMSDHGSRKDTFVETHVGAQETSNPTFFLVLPKQLRKNQKLKAILETNAQELISQHDVYATLIEIAKKSHLWNDRDWQVDWTPNASNEDWPLMHGSSYCLCELNYTTITADSSPYSTRLMNELAEAGVARLNEELARFNLTNKCAKLRLSTDSAAKIVVERLEHRLEDSTTAFKITFETLPGEGKFSGFLKAELNSYVTSFSKIVKSVKFISNTISRLNKHGDQSKCATHHPTVQPYCFCK
uniref:3-phosphoinositide-dependent protein kinase 1 n=1 Tax=Ditylenchus dipsaci TaxID=166011 RepID=A0A915CND5_9BILA